LIRSASFELARLAPDCPDRPENLAVHLNEVPVALDLLAPLLDAEAPRRILEVGSGIGAVTACLRADGHAVVAIEPAGPGFEDMLLLMRALNIAVAALQPVPALSDAPPLPIDVDDLDPVVHGRFDVVFSANVLEHVPDPISALKRMQSVLAEGGVQRHVCQNYAFPYEPHFYLPLVPFVPSFT
jgi:SAM-dependent methyltransferase